MLGASKMPSMSCMDTCLNSTCEISPSSGFSCSARGRGPRLSVWLHASACLAFDQAGCASRGPQMRDICRMFDAVTRALVASRPSISLCQSEQSAPLVLANRIPKRLYILLGVSPSVTKSHSPAARIDTPTTMTDGTNTPTTHWAVSVGINYYMKDGCLKGIVRDAETVKQYLEAGCNTSGHAHLDHIFRARLNPSTREGGALA